MDDNQRAMRDARIPEIIAKERLRAAGYKVSVYKDDKDRMFIRVLKGPLSAKIPLRHDGVETKRVRRLERSA